MYLGHASKAVDALQRIKGKGFFQDKFLDGISDRIRKSVKFSLPHNGEMITDAASVSADILSVVKLPFPRICAEYDVNYSSSFRGADHRDCNRVITVANEVGDIRSFVCGLGFKPDDTIPDADGFVMYSIGHVEYNGKKMWVPSAGFFLVPYGQDGALVEKGGSKMMGVAVPVYGALSDKEIKICGGMRAWQKKVASDYYVDCSAILNIAVCSMCSNVEAEIVKPSRLSNKLKINSGKEPVDEYRILRIKQKGQEKEKFGNSSKGRSAPRMHLRRGHVRKNANGSISWVSPAVVGDAANGSIHKSYALSR